ncbi:hypothetical protein [Geomicrobium sp. JCM 19039]|uniref:hypothetical protein n=1 Tax=Geomicrobium sp. JCM 19039 TaxID=1460636 RepID=UPI0005AADFEE|nr:hypothetical protein [Geomicrobium sp. JCM 19039]
MEPRNFGLVLMLGMGYFVWWLFQPASSSNVKNDTAEAGEIEGIEEEIEHDGININDFVEESEFDKDIYRSFTLDVDSFIYIYDGSYDGEFDEEIEITVDDPTISRNDEGYSRIELNNTEDTSLTLHLNKEDDSLQSISLYTYKTGLHSYLNFLTLALPVESKNMMHSQKF